MKRFLCATVVLMLAVPAALGAEDKESRGGLFSEGSFLSEAISSVTDKLDKVASGQEKIVDDNARGMKETMEYGSDPLGRSRSATANDDYRNYRKKMVRESEQDDPSLSKASSPAAAEDQN